MEQSHYKLTSREVNESSPSWSPDGSRIAFVSSAEGHGSEIYVYWVENDKIARLTQTERSPSNLSWSSDSQHLAFSMLVPEEAPTLVSPPVKPEGAEWAEHPRVTTRLKHEADGSGYLEPGYRQYFVLPADGGTARQITQGEFQHRSTPVWTKDEQSLIFSSNRNDNWEYDFRNSEIYRVSIADGQVTTLTDRNGPDEEPALSPDGSQILYVGFDDRVQTYQISNVYVMDADGSDKKQIPLELDRSVSSPVWATDGKGFYFQYDDEGNTKIGYATLNGKSEVVTGNLGGTSIGRPYGGGSYSVSNNGTIVFTHTTPYHPSELAMVRRGDEAKQITHLNQDLLDYRQLGKVEEIWYKSSVDDLDVQGWMVKPPAFDPNREYPLLVENHGGPISNYGDRFSPEMQLMAADGYVVFYPNPAAVPAMEKNLETCCTTIIPGMTTMM